MARGDVRATHTIQPIEVHVNGDKAVSESTGSISIRFTSDGSDYDCVSYTRFISRLRQYNCEWRILTLEAIYECDKITPVTPLIPPIMHLKCDLTGMRESYKCIGWLLNGEGFLINPNLPGIDNPSSMANLMEDSLPWIRG
ncbi:uncharacterized protein N7458_012755 [Penicillium daleae]|uniref:SnoaL-like domain-containing protein n=1 Tax=Penicillium daleae TaxID=63821 RepID=A0AAD6BXN2_9EURO|nr:uncharacterized protein N7458_012755 [Penicillium daleae]KAJ5433599.1 hypothetical protein N7458_012755 [Penicillium daleae]